VKLTTIILLAQLRKKVLLRQSVGYGTAPYRKPLKTYKLAFVSTEANTLLQQTIASRRTTVLCHSSQCLLCCQTGPNTPNGWQQRHNATETYAAGPSKCQNSTTSERL